MQHTKHDLVGWRLRGCNQTQTSRADTSFSRCALSGFETSLLHVAAKSAELPLIWLQRRGITSRVPLVSGVEKVVQHMVLLSFAFILRNPKVVSSMSPAMLIRLNTVLFALNANDTAHMVNSLTCSDTIQSVVGNSLLSPIVRSIAGIKLYAMGKSDETLDSFERPVRVILNGARLDARGNVSCRVKWS